MFKMLAFVSVGIFGVVFMLYIIVNPPQKDDPDSYTTWEEYLPGTPKALTGTEEQKALVESTGALEVATIQTGSVKAPAIQIADQQKDQEITKKEEFSLSIDLIQKGAGTYEIQGKITSDTRVRKVSVESCNSSRDANKLDNEPYTLKSVKASGSTSYTFSYKIGPKQKNICNVPYVIRAYDTTGKLLDESSHKLAVSDSE